MKCLVDGCDLESTRIETQYRKGGKFELTAAICPKHGVVRHQKESKQTQLSFDPRKR